MRSIDCKQDTPVYLKHQSTYGSMKVKRLVPKTESKTSYFVVEVYHSSNNDFDFALLKRYPLSALSLKPFKQ